MNHIDLIQRFWKAVILQDKDTLRECICDDGRIRWINSNEEFNREEYIRANCEYPGEWGGTVERIEIADVTIITVSHIYTLDKSMSFHVTSFFQLENKRIKSLDEYWGDDSEAPRWRKDLNIGRKIRERLDT